jgi:hypothetical protein
LFLCCDVFFIAQQHYRAAPAQRRQRAAPAQRYEQRATASSANDDVVADDEQEQTSAQTVALIPTIVWHVTVRIYLYIDDILVVIIPSNSTLPL